MRFSLFYSPFLPPLSLLRPSFRTMPPLSLSLFLIPAPAPAPLLYLDRNSAMKERGKDDAIEITIIGRIGRTRSGKRNVARFVYFYFVGIIARQREEGGGGGGGGHVYERTREDEEHARHAEISTGTIMSMA